MKLTKLNYVEQAEKVMKGLCVTDKRGNTVINLTTSKIRGLLAMASELYNEAVHTPGETLGEDMLSQIQYLKMRFAYEAGRDEVVKNFVEKADIFGALNQIGNKKENLILFFHYLESLVAYRKFYGGKED